MLSPLELEMNDDEEMNKNIDDMSPLTSSSHILSDSKIDLDNKKINKKTDKPIIKRGVLDDGFYYYIKNVLNSIIFNSKINILMIFIPFALLGWSNEWSDGIVFFFSLLALIPLAELLGNVTEELCLYTNEGIGALLNVTMGNFPEIIISISALKHEYYRVVQLNLLGSILSNLLLVLGSGFLIGGIKHPKQEYKKISGHINSGLLMLGTMGLLLPAALHLSNQDDNDSELQFSRFVSIILLLMYICYLFFQFYTHVYEFNNDDEDDDDDECVLGMWGCIIILIILAIFISFLSDALVDTIKGAAEDCNINTVFLSTIIIPVAGNAVEHGASLLFAHRNKMNIAVNIAVGSSTQISLFAIPLLVIISWVMGKELSLYFRGFETATMLLSVILATFLILDGKSNWLIGMMLIGAYIIIAGGFWFHENENLEL